ncbi:MAG: SCO family protein [Betaproteobacteria bacterium]|nr:MAG: SCO family protein [Betaproteobacteria bacterium]
MTTIWRASFALLAAALLAACQPAGPKFKSTDLTGADYGRSLALADHNGKPRTLADFRGKLVVLTFGFTHCPDICPTILADLAGVMQSLGKDADRVQVLFVTVDPERDTPELLAKYVAAFEPRFLGLYGNAEATARTAKEFKVFYEKRKSGESYSVDHSAQSYVIDAQGRLRLFVRHDRIAADLGDDLKTLLRSG